jgi:hypothetical protein
MSDEWVKASIEYVNEDHKHRELPTYAKAIDGLRASSNVLPK